MTLRVPSAAYGRTMNRRASPRPLGRLPFVRWRRVSLEVRDFSGYAEVNLLNRIWRRERAHNADKMVERERWDLLG